MLIGFVLAVVAFVFIFLRVRARTAYLVSAFGAAAVLMLLGILGAALVLEFQHGLLQIYVSLPWPFL